MKRFVFGSGFVGFFGIAAIVAACSSTEDAPAPAADAAPETSTTPEEDAAFADPPCPPSGVSKGPWSIAMTRAGARVRWEACRADAMPGLVLRPEAGGAETMVSTTAKETRIVTRQQAPLNKMRSPDDAPGTYWLVEAVVDGLPASTCYHYELAADRSRGGRFCTARADGDEVHFIAIGDTNPLLGDDTSKLFTKVLPLGPDFVVHGGDIQYYSSGFETWSGWFPAMQPLLSQGALLPALGNHELETPEELDDYSRRFFGWPDFGGSAMWYRFESGGVFFHMLDTEASLLPGSPQGTWLMESLAAASSTPGFRFSTVVMHRPFVTCGDSAQNDSARKAFASAFAQHKVALVLQAHVHDYERFEIDGVTFLTTGGGGALLGDPDDNVSRPECAMRKSAGAFFHAVDIVVPKAPDKVVRGKAIDETGAVKDSFTITLPSSADTR